MLLLMPVWAAAEEKEWVAEDAEEAWAGEEEAWAEGAHQHDYQYCKWKGGHR